MYGGKVYNKIQKVINDRNTLAAEQGAVLINAVVSQRSIMERQQQLPENRVLIYENADRSNDCFELSDGDIVVVQRWTGNFNREVTANPLNKNGMTLVDSPEVIGSLNGFSVEVKRGETADQARKRWVKNFWNNYRVLGVALRAYKEKGNMLTHSIQLQGIMTFRNAGVDTINPFELVRAVVPEPEMLKDYPATLGHNNNRFTRVNIMMEPIRAKTSYISPEDIREYCTVTRGDDIVDAETASAREKAIASLATLLGCEDSYNRLDAREVLMPRGILRPGLMDMIVSFFQLGEEVRSSARFYCLSKVGPGADGDFFIMQQ